MSSMLALIRKGRVMPQFSELTQMLMPQLKSPEMVPARIDCAAADMDNFPANARILPELAKLPRPVPPYALMWLESKVANYPVNALVIRKVLSSGGHSVGIMPWWDAGKGPFPTSLCSYETLRDGSYVDGSLKIEGMLPNKLGHGVVMQCFVIAHWCARSQCKNARLVQMHEGRFVPRSPNVPIPMSSWRELEIFEEPKEHSTGRSVLPGEKKEIRCSWVRGHFADYRFGSGHFGRADCKYVLWIPEHKRGDEKLGTIKPGYIVN